MAKPLSLIMRKNGHYLYADYPLVQEALATVHNDQEVRVQITTPRSLKHHKLLFGLLNIVQKAQPEPVMFPTVESLLDALKLATGHVKEVRDLKGHVMYVPASIDFASLPQHEFAEWFNQAVRIILERVLPNTKSETLENEIYRALGEIAPSDLQR